jgi:hypothetical protein
VLGAPGVTAITVDRDRVFWRTATGVFSVTLPIEDQPATVGNGSFVVLDAIGTGFHVQ